MALAYSGFFAHAVHTMSSGLTCSRHASVVFKRLLACIEQVSHASQHGLTLCTLAVLPASLLLCRHGTGITPNSHPPLLCRGLPLPPGSVAV